MRSGAPPPPFHQFEVPTRQAIISRDRDNCVIRLGFAGELDLTLRLTRLSRDRLAHLADQLCRGLIKANHRAHRISLFGVEIKHVLHPRDIGAIDLRNAPHVPPPRLQIVLGEAPTYRLTRHPFMVSQSDYRSGQQIQRPALASLGGWSRQWQSAALSPCLTACGLPLDGPLR